MKIYGLSRTRDKKGNIIKRELKNVVNCIHTMVGSGYENMQVLIVEEYEEDDAHTDKGKE